MVYMGLTVNAIINNISNLMCAESIQEPQTRYSTHCTSCEYPNVFVEAPVHDIGDLMQSHSHYAGD